ncbi:hypothetical protein AGMMS49941_11200 [Deferribacterales bacterium]|nr:hypothetical protein AGMMS49941_11200 [Deferribacterales bacterium]
MWVFNIAIATLVVSEVAGVDSLMSSVIGGIPIKLAPVVWLIYALNAIPLLEWRAKLPYLSTLYLITAIITPAVLYILVSYTLPTTLFVDIAVYMRDVPHLIVTMPVIALLYYYLPLSIGAPMLHLRFALLSYVAISICYMLNSARALAYLPNLFFIAIPATLAVATNLLTTIYRYWQRAYDKTLLKFFLVSVICYAIGSLLPVWNNTLGYMGFVGFAIYACIYYLIPKLYNVYLYSGRLMRLQLNLMLIGLTITSIASFTATIIKRTMLDMRWVDGATLMWTWQDIVPAVQIPLIIERTGQLVYAIGALLFTYNIIRTLLIPRKEGKGG